MTHDQECTFDPKFCSMCKLQAEARADEREQAARRVTNLESWYDEKESFKAADGMFVSQVWVDLDETIAVIRNDENRLNALRLERTIDSGEQK